MLLSELAEIIQGNIPTRIEVKDGMRVELLTMQDLNYFANLSNEETTTKYIRVQSDRIKSLSFVKEGDVVVSLSSCKAVVIDIKVVNRLVLSNLAIIRIYDKDALDPNFLCWYINRNPNAIKKFKQLQQGTHTVSIIPLSTVKNIDLEIIPISVQRKIGIIYELQRQRYRTNQIIEQKKAGVLSYQLMKIFEQEIYNG
jgi:restriction endonuclease S subunit